MPNSNEAPKLPPGHELERVAARANTTVQTVRNYIRRKPGKPRIAARVRLALIELGFHALVTDAPAAAHQ